MSVLFFDGLSIILIKTAVDQCAFSGSFIHNGWHADLQRARIEKRVYICIRWDQPMDKMDLEP